MAWAQSKAQIPSDIEMCLLVYYRKTVLQTVLSITECRHLQRSAKIWDSQGQSLSCFPCLLHEEKQHLLALKESDLEKAESYNPGSQLLRVSKACLQRRLSLNSWTHHSWNLPFPPHVCV